MVFGVRSAATAAASFSFSSLAAAPSSSYESTKRWAGQAEGEEKSARSSRRWSIRAEATRERKEGEARTTVREEGSKYK